MFWHYGELLSRQHGRSLGILLFACALLAGSTESYSNSRPGHKRVPSGSNRAKVQDFEYAQSIDGDSTSMQVEAEPITSRRTLMTSMAMTCLMVSMSESANAQGLRQEATPSSLPTEIVAADAAGADTIDLSGILQKAWRKALGGGKAGASASVVQVLSLMWLRTSMNYQYRYGGNLKTSLKALLDDGGIPRLYQGLPFALIQGSLTRFGDTAANVGILALLEITPATQSLPLPIKTALGSISAGTWRIFLMPIDASKTALQVEGKDGLKDLWSLAATDGIGVLYQGALAQAAATAAGHFPWFLTYNFLNEQLPDVASSDDFLLSLGRTALIGCSASCVSDTVSNSLRVIKTTKQTARLSKEVGTQQVGIDKSQELSYPDIVRLIIEEDGVKGLFGRGLQTRLLTNSIQGAVFSVLWKYFQQVGSS